jgi:hypothetical protein
VPPHNAEAEKALICSLMMLPENLELVLREICLDDFHLPAMREMFRAIVAVDISGINVEPISVAEELSKTAKLDLVGGYSALIEMLETIPHGANALYHARLIAERSRRRTVIMRTTDLLLLARDETVPTDDLLDRASEITANLSPVRAERFPAMTANELMSSNFDIEYLIEGMLAAREFGILIGPKKSLKTSLALLMAVCLATGTPLFGTFAVPNRKRVGFMSGESGPGTVRNCFRRICDSLIIQAETIENFAFCFSVPILDVSADITAVERFIVNNRLEVLFIDCFYLMLGGLGGNAPNLFVMGGALSKLLTLQSKTGCTICLVHHTPKNMPCKVPELDDAAFAGVAEVARQWILLNRMERYNPMKPGQHKLWLVAGGSAGHSTVLNLGIDEGAQTDPGGRKWIVNASNSVEHRPRLGAHGHKGKGETVLDAQAIELESDRKTITETLTRLGRVDTKTGIRDESAIPPARFNKAWDTLLNDGAVVLFGTIKKGNNQSHDGYCLAVRIDEFRSRQ